MTWASDWSLTVNLLVFGLSTLVILIVGIRMARAADQLADLSGLGEAVFGAALLGGSTSLPGIVTSVIAAASDHPEMAISNAIGGIAVQTAFLAVADIAYRRANLEHTAASVENLVNGALLCGLLALVLVAANGPNWSLFAIHPVSVIILIGYAFGLKLASRAHEDPAWTPKQTGDTESDTAESINLQLDVRKIWVQFGAYAVAIGAAGLLLGISGIGLVRSTGLSESIVGGLFTAISSSLPELVTAIAAVRQGSPTLAVGGIIGGNTFDVLFVAFSDVAYREGSIYHAMGQESVFLIALTIVMTSILLLGLLRRERRGPGNIGFEGILVLTLYAGGFLTIGLGLIAT